MISYFPYNTNLNAWCSSKKEVWRKTEIFNNHRRFLKINVKRNKIINASFESSENSDSYSDIELFYIENPFQTNELKPNCVIYRNYDGN